MKILTVIMGLFLITNSFSQSLTQSQTSTKEEAILEAVFRHQMKHCCMEVTKRTFYLSLGGGKDPSAKFMKRFAKEKLQVKKLSQERGGQNRIMYAGIRLNISTVRDKSEAEVEVIGSCSVAPMNGGSFFYRVVLQDGYWVVKESQNAGEA